MRHAENAEEEPEGDQRRPANAEPDGPVRLTFEPPRAEEAGNRGADERQHRDQPEVLEGGQVVHFGSCKLRVASEDELRLLDSQLATRNPQLSLQFPPSVGIKRLP